MSMSMDSAHLMKPIFVIGAERSGTTMLGSMIGAHSDVLCLPESNFIAVYMPTSDPQQPVDAAAALRLFRSHYKFRTMWRDVRIDEKSLGAETGAVTFPQLVDWLVRQYASSVGKRSATSWVDHAPNNLLYVHRLNQHFPDSKFVHIVRDGRAFANSMIAADWGPNDVIEAAERWIYFIGLGMIATNYLGERRIITVKYEDVVLNTEESMGRIAKFLGLEFQPAMCSPTGLSVPGFIKKTHALLGAGVEPKRLDAWKRKLTPRDIEILESKVGDLLQILGYERLTEISVKPPSDSEYYLHKTMSVARSIKNKLAHLKRYYAS